MNNSGSDASERPPVRGQTNSASQPTVLASLAHLRNAFGSGEDQEGQSTAPPAAVAAAPAYPFGVGPGPSRPYEMIGLQGSPIDLDHHGTSGLYTFQSATPASAVPANVDAQAHTPPITSAAVAEAGIGMSGARQYFHVSPPSPVSNNNSNSNNKDDHDVSQVQSSPAAQLFPPSQQQQGITHHAISGSSSDGEEGDDGTRDAAHHASTQAPPPALSIPPPPPPRFQMEEGEEHEDGPHQRSDSSSSSLDPPRSPARPLSAEERQAARLRAYSEMLDPDGTTAGDGGGGAHEAGSKRGFFTDTLETLLPDRVTRWFSRSVDVVAQQSSTVVPNGVKRVASAAANTIGSGAQHIGDAIEQMPGMVVNAIPTAIMSNEVKQLLFTDFSNTFRSFFHTNILSMPFIIRQAGLVGGIFLLTFVAITSEYATEAYFGAKNQMKNAHKVIVYGDVPKMVWGRWYPMINIFYGVTHLIGFIAFSASNSVVLLGAMGMHGGGARALGLIIPSLIALPLVLMKNAHSQEPLSIMSNLLVFTAVILMFVDFPYKPTPPIKLWPSSATEFFVAMGVSVYAFTGIGSCIPVERVMPARRYRKLLRASVAIAYSILLAFGISGFLSYGDHTCSVMTVSLQKGALRTAVSALLFFASIMIIPQQTFPLCELSDRRLLGITGLTTYWDLKPNIMRIMYLVVSAFAAFIIPYYGLLLSISGALGCGIVGLVIPAALDYVRRERKGLHHGRTMRFWEYVVVFGLGFYGCVVVVIGVVSGSYQLWISIQTESTDTC
jgi:amino acid permease